MLRPGNTLKSGYSDFRENFPDGGATLSINIRSLFQIDASSQSDR